MGRKVCSRAGWLVAGRSWPQCRNSMDGDRCESLPEAYADTSQSGIAVLERPITTVFTAFPEKPSEKGNQGNRIRKTKATL